MANNINNICCDKNVVLGSQANYNNRISTSAIGGGGNESSNSGAVGASIRPVLNSVQNPLSTSYVNNACSNSNSCSKSEAGAFTNSSSTSSSLSCSGGSCSSSSRSDLCAMSLDSGCSGSLSLSNVVVPQTSTTSTTPNTVRAAVVTGPKFKLLQSGDIQVCRLNHTRTVISKILSSKFLRRWESHHLVLGHSNIHSKTPTGFMEDSIPYSAIEDIYIVTRWDSNQNFCIRVVVMDGSLLLQMSNSYLRDQWFHSIQWKKSLFRYQRLLSNAVRCEVLLKEIKSLVELAVTTPLQAECIYSEPLEIISELLPKASKCFAKAVLEDILVSLVPLLDRSHPTPEICDCFSKQCKENPRSSLVLDIFTPVVQRILKHNVDFGKFPRTRIFLQDYVVALGAKNEGMKVIENFVESIHGAGSNCPHPRVLPNLVSVCLAAIYTLFESRQSVFRQNVNESPESLLEDRLQCYVACFVTIAAFEDWRPALSQLLQPIPFPDKALAHEKFTRWFEPVIEALGTDPRCDVHLMVLGIREGKEGWFHLYCPGNLVCRDEGQLWAKMLNTLLNCCCRRKRFLCTMNKMLGQCMLLALRDSAICQDILCAMLELEVVENNDNKLQMVTTLQSTASGRKNYAALCERQMHLRELQQKGGPRKLTLPSRSTDADVAKLLSCGSFGNLECLSLAFTQVTSACAEQLIKLPSLKYLNLWSTQFGDAGLQLISEHLHKLQVLNLCETPVTDKGLVSLAAMKNLRKLNLNSTSLSAYTFEGLKQKLPALQECDVRYTDAW